MCVLQIPACIADSLPVRRAGVYKSSVQQSDAAVLVHYRYWEGEKEDLVCIGQWTAVPCPPALIQLTDITDSRIYEFTHKTADIIDDEQQQLLEKVQVNPGQYMEERYIDVFNKHFAVVRQEEEEEDEEDKFVPGENVLAQHINSPSAIMPVKGTPKKLYPAVVREVAGELISVEWTSTKGDKKRKRRYDPQLVHTSRVIKKRD